MKASISESLNFSWLEDKVVAGSAAPMLPEDLAFLNSQGVRAIVRLAYPGKDDYVLDTAVVERAGLTDRQIPVEDFHAPSFEQVEEAINFIDAQVRLGKSVVVSCGAGCGRTGTILACYLVAKGRSPDEALDEVIEKRPCTREIIERTPAQKAVIYQFAERIARDPALLK